MREDLHVALASCELVVDCVLDVHNVEATVVTLTMSDDADTTHVTTTSSHDNDTGIKLDEVGDLAGRQVDLHSIIDLDSRVGIPDSVFRQQNSSAQCLSNG